MKLLPLVYVTDMDRSVDFYSKLLPASSIVTTSPYWTEMQVGNASLALHISELVDHANDGMGLGLDAATPLEDVVVHLNEVGIRTAGEICAQPFGRSVTVADPDGLVIQINEHSVPSAN
ncbi:MAG: VOC family protein [Acidimicrobiia bacterium]|nr:VOC family protein [Acidimicrobiia bacterium]MDX2467096.1 VOC family protein [Acidimicrobiia bacterium]